MLRIVPRSPFDSQLIATLYPSRFPPHHPISGVPGTTVSPQSLQLTLMVMPFGDWYDWMISMISSNDCGQVEGESYRRPAEQGPGHKRGGGNTRAAVSAVELFEGAPATLNLLVDWCSWGSVAEGGGRK